MSLREIEKQVQALAPVIASIIKEQTGAIENALLNEIAKRDDVIKSLTEDIASLKAQKPQEIDVDAVAKAAAALIPEPRPSDKGDSVTVDDVMPAIKGFISEAVSQMQPEKIDIDEVAKAAAAMIPTPKDGDSVAVDDVMPQLMEYVDKYLSEIRVPQDGASVSVEDVMPGLKAHVDSYLKSIPEPKPVEAPSVDEIAAVFERRFSDLTLSWERQARYVFEKAADRMPIPKDGLDAIPLEAFDVAMADERTVVMSLKAGETVIEKSIKIPALIDKGVFKKDSEQPYEKGDCVTFDGSLWICRKDAPEGIPGASPDWRLAVKKGRNGLDLRENASTFDSSKGVKVK